MRKRYLLLFMLLFVYPSIAEAAPVLSNLQTYEQPNGEKVEMAQYGDEFFHYFAGEDGSIYEKHEDGYWYYRQKDGMADIAARVGVDPKPTDTMTRSDIKDTGIQKRELFNQDLLNRQAKVWNKEQRLLVVMVEFDDVKLSSTEKEWSQKIFSDTGKTVRNFYLEQTNNRIEINPVADTDYVKSGVLKVHMKRDHPDTNIGTKFDHFQLSSDVLHRISDQIDFASYDTNKNGTIELNELHIMFVLAGDEHGASVTNKGIRGHKGYKTNLATVDGVTFTDYTMFGELMWQKSSTIGVICHEFGHDLGLPDLYNTESDDIEISGAGTGPISLMSNGMWGKTYQFNGSFWYDELEGTTPVGLDAYSKIQLGTPYEEVDVNHFQKKIVKAASENEDPTILKLQSESSKEYLLIENRQPVGFDKGMEGYIEALFPENQHSLTGSVPGGIGIYHINTNYHQNLNNDKQLVTVLEADEGTLGYSNYRKGNLFGTQPFFYKGKNLNNEEQPYKLSAQTVPSTKMADGSFLDTEIEVLSNVGNEMEVQIGKEVPLEEIQVDQKQLILEIGKTHQSIITLNPKDTTDKELFWKSLDPSVVSVTSDGAITALKEGSAKVQVSNGDGKISETVDVTVVAEYIAVENIKIESSPFSVTVNKKIQLKTTIMPEQATNKAVKWTSKDSSIASVDDRGEVTALKEGSTEITVTTVDGNKSYVAKITVIEEDDYGDTLQEAEKIEIGKTYTGRIDYDTDKDFFVVDIPADTQFVLASSKKLDGQIRQTTATELWNATLAMYQDDTGYYYMTRGETTRQNLRFWLSGKEGDEYSFKLVEYNPDALYVEQTEMTIRQGESVQIKANIDFGTKELSVAPKLTYGSLGKYLTVDKSTGIVTAIEGGVELVTVRDPFTNQFKEVRVTVLQDDDHGDSFEEATKIEIGKTYTGKIDYDTDKDFFEGEIASGEQFVLISTKKLDRVFRQVVHTEVWNGSLGQYQDETNYYYMTRGEVDCQGLKLWLSGKKGEEYSFKLVPYNPDALSVEQTEMIVKQGESIQLKAKVDYGTENLDFTPELMYGTINTCITLDKKMGVVTGVEKGTGMVSIKDPFTGKFVNVTITVIE